MRSYLVSYFYQGGQGRAFIDISNDEAPSREQVEEWERIIATQNRMQKVCVANFVEISGPAHREKQQQEAASHEQ